jgi:hypothetical protein
MDGIGSLEFAASGGSRLPQKEQQQQDILAQVQLQKATQPKETVMGEEIE